MSPAQAPVEAGAALREGPAPAAYIEDLCATFEQAAHSAGGSLDHYFAVAGFRVRLRFAGAALAQRLARALAHRTTSPGPAELTICAWDSAATGVPLPYRAWHWDGNWRRGLIDGFNDRRFRCLFQQHLDAFSLLDGDRGLGFYWMQDADRCPYYESGAPFRFLLHWWLAKHGRYLIHAAAVGTPAGGVLLAGKGGSGKSTTALACLDSELLHAGEDYVLIAGTAQPCVCSLYQSAKLHPDQLWRFPNLAGAVSNRDMLDSEKALLFLQERYAHKLAAGFPLKTILLPHITGARGTRWRPTSAAQSLAALAPSTVIQLHGLEKQALAAIVGLVERVPSYVLELGTDLSQVPPVILKLLKEPAYSCSDHSSA